MANLQVLNYTRLFFLIYKTGTQANIRVFI